MHSIVRDFYSKFTEVLVNFKMRTFGGFVLAMDG